MRELPELTLDDDFSDDSTLEEDSAIPLELDSVEDFSELEEMDSLEDNFSKLEESKSSELELKAFSLEFGSSIFSSAEDPLSSPQAIKFKDRTTQDIIPNIFFS